MKDSAKVGSVRKVVLLFAIVVLLLIYVLQVVFSHKTSVKTLYTEGEVDVVEVTRAGERLYSLLKVGDEDDDTEEGEVLWTVDGVSAQGWSARGIATAISEIKLLGVASKSQSDDERYGLNEQSVLTVKALSAGELVRTLYVGKLSATGGQTYVRVDEDKTVYVAQGNLRSTFEVTADDIKVPPPQEEGEGTDDGAEDTEDGSAGTSAEGAPAPDEEGALD